MHALPRVASTFARMLATAGEDILLPLLSQLTEITLLRLFCPPEPAVKTSLPIRVGGATSTLLVDLPEPWVAIELQVSSVGRLHDFTSLDFLSTALNCTYQY